MSSKTVRWIPHDYQCTATSFLISNPRSALFLDPGLGKTSISLAVTKILKYSEQISGVLLVAPLRVSYSVWPSEISKWANFNKLSHTILHDDNKGSIWGYKKDIYLINPEGLQWLHKELLRGLQLGRKCPFNALIIDESTKFKSHKSNRFQYVCDMLPLFNRRHILTGTPSPKSLLDLWSQIYILDEGKSLGTNYHRYRNKYFQASDWNKHDWQIKDFSKEEIYAKIANLVLDMSAEDYLNMPELIFNNIPVLLNEKAMALYKRMEREMFIELEDSQASAEAAAQATMKCHQIANGNVYEDIPIDLNEEEIKQFRKIRKTLHVHDDKLEALKDLIEELNGKPIIIAYHFKHDLEALKKALGKNIPHIGSGVSSKKSKELENKWNKGELPILLGHISSMAHGLNMQKGGNDICFYSVTSDLELYVQFYRRVYRQGVKGNQVRVHHLVAMNTVDEAFMCRLGERADQEMDLRAALREYRRNIK